MSEIAISIVPNLLAQFIPVRLSKLQFNEITNVTIIRNCIDIKIAKNTVVFIKKNNNCHFSTFMFLQSDQGYVNNNSTIILNLLFNRINAINNSVCCYNTSSEHLHELDIHKDINYIIINNKEFFIRDIDSNLFIPSEHNSEGFDKRFPDKNTANIINYKNFEDKYKSGTDYLVKITSEAVFAACTFTVLNLLGCKMDSTTLENGKNNIKTFIENNVKGVQFNPECYMRTKDAFKAFNKEQFFWVSIDKPLSEQAWG